MRGRLIGFGSSLVFTLTSFLIFFRPDFFHWGMNVNITAVLILAVLQASAQSIFFLNVLKEEKPHWNLLIYASTIGVVLVVILFSIWIINHLNYNMMPIGTLQ